MVEINFARRFILNFARMVKPIHNLLRKDQKFACTLKTKNIFVKSKKIHYLNPYFGKVDVTKDFLIYTNAIEESISTILLWKDGSIGNPIVLISQSLSNVEMKYTSIEKHVYAEVEVFQIFRHFILEHTEIKVPLPVVKFLLYQIFLPNKLVNWLTKIQECDFTTTFTNIIKGQDLALFLS